MHFVYVDDSGDGNFVCFSALIIPADQWRDTLDHLLGCRRQMRQSDGIYVQQEFHATDWNGKRGQIANRPVTPERRAQLFDFFLSSIAMIPGAALINAAAKKRDQDRAFEWMLNRVNINMKRAGSHAVIFCDEGKNYDHIRRKTGAFNFISSRYGNWPDGSPARNIPNDRLLEDIVYRDSARSVLIQAADACAYALLRREKPLEAKSRLGLDQSFGILDRILVKGAYSSDPLGIIRA